MRTDRTTSLRTDVDAEEVKATITRALAKRSTLPPYPELNELHQALLEHIEVLEPLAVEHVDGLNHGTVEWYRKRAKLDSIPYELSQGLGSGLQSAASHVRSLGHILRFLLENSGVLGCVE
ncbi:DUF6415 family natural product biosynthesis protein [Streptomyces sirii]|uniref:DUF6415 family natural product biosynthesis protein n=1 Tax=Streptomyces sirii TaxID=3127701 RepID=UPI003D35F6D1